MLNSKRDSDVDQRTEHVMRSKLTELASAAALAGAAVLATGTDASAYRWHRPPVVGIAAGSLIRFGWLSAILRPTHARMKHQRNEPRTVMMLKAPKPILINPAGMEIRCRAVREPRFARA